MADNTVDLVTVPGVELLHTGRFRLLVGGEQNFTSEDLAAAVSAQEDPGVRSPIIKLGHVTTADGDPNTDGTGNFERPAIGRVKNLRLSADGQALLGDFVGVPRWFAEAMPSAYPGRSIEAFRNFTTDTGTKHSLVLTAVALLGEHPPAISTLADVQSLFVGASASSDPDRLVVCAGATAMPEPILASTNLEDVRRAFYEQRPAGDFTWIREMWSDFLIVDDDSGSIHRIPWSEDGEAVTFGDPEEVRVQYVAASGPSALAAGAGDSTLLDRFSGAELVGDGEGEALPPADTDAKDGGEVQYEEAGKVYTQTHSTDGPDVTTDTTDTNEAVGQHAGRDDEEQTVERAHLAERLGMDPSTPEDELLARLDEILANTETPQDDPATDAVDEVDADADVDVDDADEVEADLVAEPVAAGSSMNLPEGVVVVDEATLVELRASAEEGRQARAQQVAEHRRRTLDEAIQAGKFPPAHRQRWEQRFEQDPEGTEDLIVNLLQAGLVPVDEAGHAGDGEALNTDRVQAELQGSLMFPQLDQSLNR